MEGGSVNLICNEMGVPSLILRSISDTADGDAPENFDSLQKWQLIDLLSLFCHY